MSVQIKNIGSAIGLIMLTFLVPHESHAAPIEYISWLSDGETVTGSFAMPLTGSIESSHFYRITVGRDDGGLYVQNVGLIYTLTGYDFTGDFRGTYTLYSGIYSDTASLPEQPYSVITQDSYHGSYAYLKTGDYTVALNGYFVTSRQVWDGSYSFTMYNIANAPPAASIPEPETYVMMLAGLGLVGAFARWGRNKQ